MLMNGLRNNRYAAIVLTLVRLYLGWEWTKAGWHKLTGGFDAGGYLKGAIAKPVLESGTQARVYPNFVGFLHDFALPNVKLFNFLVPWGELLVGIGLLLGAFTTAAVFFGLLMNFMYMFAGTVSTNPWLVLLGFFIIAAGSNAGKIGLDHYLLPLVRQWWMKGKEAAGGRKRTRGNHV